MFTASFSGMSVNDIELAKEFYVNVLNCKLLDEEMGLFLELPGGKNHFIYAKPDHQPAAYTVLNFEVENIDDVVVSLNKKGIIFEQYDWGNDAKTDQNGIMRSPDPSKYGPNIAWFKDPAGNILAILERIKDKYS